MAKLLPTPEMLRKLLRLEKETGKLFWNHRPRCLFKSDRDCSAWNSRYSGKEAFVAKNNHGYHIGTIFNRKVSAHRVVWAMVNGEWPDGMLDHVDRTRSNNKIGNLRLATRCQNARNRGSAQGATSNYIGVSWNAFNKKWAATIRKNGKQSHIGYFKSEKAAAEAYDNEAIKQFGEFSNPNF